MSIENILLVGAGELGSRHLQSLVSQGLGEYERRVFVYDPSERALALSRGRVEQIDRSELVTVTYSSALDFQLHSFGLVIVATNASVRLAVITDVFNKYEVKYLLLEKVLFQSFSDLDRAKSLIANSVDGAWVNCPRRLFPSYAEVLKKVAKLDSARMTVSGRNWGLACNSIHFIDLWFNLFGIHRYSLHLDDLSKEVLDSKRVGFKELQGKITCNYEGYELILESSDDSMQSSKLEITIKSGSLEINVNEVNKQVEIIDNEQEERDLFPFESLYQSQMTGEICKSILKNGSCGLTEFHESYQIHKPFLIGMLEHFRKYDDPLLTFSPIT